MNLMKSESLTISHLMHTVPQLFDKFGPIEPVVEYFLANERELLQLLNSNSTFNIIIHNILCEDSLRSEFIQLVCRHLEYLMLNSRFRIYLIIECFVKGLQDYSFVLFQII
jgi:hypothetical protein